MIPLLRIPIAWDGSRNGGWISFVPFRNDFLKSTSYRVLVDILGYTVHPLGDGNWLMEIGGENMYLKWTSFLDLILGNI
jgi:hypothetical protein